jgi:hypothetical protein
MQLVDQHENQPIDAGQDFEIEGFDLDLGFVDEILDRLFVLARLEAPAQVRRLLDHADRLLKGAIGDGLRRRRQTAPRRAAAGSSAARPASARRCRRFSTTLSAPARKCRGSCGRWLTGSQLNRTRRAQCRETIRPRRSRSFGVPVTSGSWISSELDGELGLVANSGRSGSSDRPSRIRSSQSGHDSIPHFQCDRCCRRAISSPSGVPASGDCAASSAASFLPSGAFTCLSASALRAAARSGRRRHQVIALEKLLELPDRETLPALTPLQQLQAELRDQAIAHATAANLSSEK